MAKSHSFMRIQWEHIINMDGGKENIFENSCLRPDTVPERCSCEDCQEDLSIESVLVKTSNGVPYKLKCPECDELFDQACPICGSKDTQVKGGVEECVHCGRVLEISPEKMPPTQP